MSAWADRIQYNTCAHLRLLFASVAALSVPPLGTSGVNEMASGTGNADTVARD